MKKIIAILTVLLVITGCGSTGGSSTEISTADAKALYTESIDVVKVVNADISMEMSEGDVKSKITMKLRNADNFDKATAHMSIGYDEETMEYFMSEKFMYIDLMGMKMKIEATEKDFLESFNPEEAIGTEFDFGVEDFDLFTVSRKGNLVTYIIDTDKAQNLPEELKESKGTVTYIIDEKTKSLMSVEMLMVNGETSSFKLNADYRASGEITMPDFSEYETINP